MPSRWTPCWRALAVPARAFCSTPAAAPVPVPCWNSCAGILKSRCCTITPTHGRRQSTTAGEELQKFVAAAHPLGVTVVEDSYDPQQFYTAVAGLENEPERGSRCTVCYRLRMRRAAQYARDNGFDWFTTTLSISPHKDAARVNAIGQELEAEFGVKHLPSDFKKHNGYLRSLQLSEQYGLYRQDYCGCEFSAKARGIEE